MIFKKVLLIIGLLVAFVLFLSGDIQTAKAQTMEELSAQISALQAKMAAYQKEMTDLQARISFIQSEMAKIRAELAGLLAKQISLIQNQIAQLQSQLAKPESEYKCPDLNRDGIVDIYDVTLISARLNTCQGNTNYDGRGDVDGDGCLTNNDLNFVQKYYGKKTKDVEQCKGIVIPPRSPKPESEYLCPDLNGDGIVDIYDTVIISAKINSCEGEANYDAKGDINGDGCLTEDDMNFVTKYYGKKTEEISPQCVPIKPESEYKCPDLNKDGIVDIYDVTLISARLNTCQGNTNYDGRGDVDGDGCLTNNDLNFVQKYYGKKTTEITQCQGVTITPVLSASISANPSSGNAPLTGVDLIANVSGTATGSINYTFYCNRSDAGTNITSGWCSKKDGVSQDSYTAFDCCNFYSAGTYVLKVIVERGNVQSEARKTILINPPLPSSTKKESEYKCPDLNRDGIVDIYDTIIVTASIYSCKGATNYDARGDVDSDNCITTNDSNFVNKYYGKRATEIVQCGGIVVTPKPESEYACPDLNKDGLVDIYDVLIISANLNKCKGDVGYDERGDVDGDGCLTSIDLNYVQKYYGKKAEEIDQCKKETTLKYIERMAASITDAIFQIIKKVEELQR